MRFHMKHHFGSLCIGGTVSSYVGFFNLEPTGEIVLLGSLKVIENAISPTPSSLDEESSSKKLLPSALFFFIGGLIVLLILLIILFLFWKFIRPAQLRKSKKCENSCKASFCLVVLKVHFGGNLWTISYFRFKALKKATKNFHECNLLGKGGFGPVYLGKLQDGRRVAVKKLSLDKSQGEAEFLAEVRIITSIQHKNLVRLLGCCSEGPQRLLVYEYMKNRSLDLIIYGKNDQYLNWSTRFQIILGIARGLQYLHEDSHTRIVHSDIKASNILLTGNFQPRIGDFGLARFFPEDEAYLSTAFAGTLGYTAPEYAIKGELSEKADIYSFGVLVLEIISCRKNTDLTLPSEMQYLPEYAWKLYERSKMIDLIDPRMQNDGFVEKEVMQTILVALLCLQPQAKVRPPMSEIVAMLTWKVEMVKSPIKPTFLDGRKRMKDDEKVSWEAISDYFSSFISESIILTQPPNSGDFNVNQSSSAKPTKDFRRQKSAGKIKHPPVNSTENESPAPSFPADKSAGKYYFRQICPPEKRAFLVDIMNTNYPFLKDLYGIKAANSSHTSSFSFLSITMSNDTLVSNAKTEPYGIHHSDSPSTILVSPLLTQENYGSWSRAITMALGAKTSWVSLMVLFQLKEKEEIHYCERCNDLGHCDNFSTIRRQILLMTPFPSIQLIYNMVCQEENNKK
ncbi:cysteine-rich receptor-like protein kinase 42 [Cynara cardunculus var. scolymus]|uniref:cysteine-rich receptor-like protein kinase 42 n=1 Tax=Cynara cardunculus var. scolymus TaxID=59895 RepID=UPI000D62EF50|nr:cysteine-rich receptor-like protein kinase 42 [Cynara cardunculus var. scolymus]